MKRSVILSESRDVPLLLFLWKWKVATTATLIYKFFPDCKPKTAYNRLLALRQARMIRIKSDDYGEHFVYTMDQKGFLAIRSLLPILKEEGYKSEAIGHDLLVSAFHLGDWLKEKPNSVTLFSEQQLRRVDPEFFPTWVPKSSVHRPDGYSLIGSEEKGSVYAIEVELSQKRDSDYLQTAEFYSHFKSIDRVFWLISKKNLALLIFDKLKKASHYSEFNHSMILLDEFKSQGWNAPIRIGADSGKTLKIWASGKAQELPRNSTDTRLTHHLLDSRKTPYFPKTYRPFIKAEFTD